jgi:hypothetical protein
MATIKNVMADIYVSQIKKIMKEKKYVFFDSNMSLNLNIIGIRKNETVSNHFDDNMCVVYRNSCKEWEVFTAAATTDPGKTSLINPPNSKGTAILMPGQYRGSHKIDLHAGKYTALRQSGGKVKVWRDNNRDAYLDMDGSKIEEGYFGINIHRASSRGETALVNSYSAGCQVLQDVNDFYKFMELCESSAAKYGNGFTYTLLEEEDFLC